MGLSSFRNHATVSVHLLPRVKLQGSLQNPVTLAFCEMIESINSTHKVNRFHRKCRVYNVNS